MTNSNIRTQYYDNEAISCLVVENVIANLSSISVAKSLLILPILLHDPIINRFSTSAKYRSIDEFLVKERVSLGDLNSRMQDMLPLTINTLSILLDLNILKLDGITLEHVPAKTSTSKDVGIRAKKIIKVIQKGLFLFKEEDAVSYLKFNLEL